MIAEIKTLYGILKNFTFNKNCIDNGGHQQHRTDALIWKTKLGDTKKTKNIVIELRRKKKRNIKRYSKIHGRSKTRRGGKET